MFEIASVSTGPAFGSEDKVFSNVITGDGEGSALSAAVRETGKVDGGKRAKNRSSLGGSDCASLTFGRDVAMMIANRQK